MRFGAAISLTHRTRRRSIEMEDDGSVRDSGNSIEDFLQDSIQGANSKPHFANKALSLGIIGFAIIVTLFGVSGVSFAQTETATSNLPTQSKLLQDGSGNGTILKGTKSSTGEIIPMVINPKVEEIAKELRCPTCVGLSVLESGTLQSVAMRTEIEKQLSEGKSKTDIMNYFKKAYCSWILREPDSNSSIGVIIWGIPILGLIFGPIFILLGLRNSKKRQMLEEEELVNEIKKFISEKKAEVCL